MGAKERLRFRQAISDELKLSDEDKVRLELNVAILDQVLTTDENILKATVLDENKPHDSADRKSESDVLEAFVRINREGTPLSRSDLIFSMLKLHWEETAETLPELVDNINEGNSFELDTDFVIRCLFAVSDLGTKFNIDLIRKKSNVQKIKSNFQECCNAIRSTVDFVQNECWVASSRLLGGYYNLVPFVYYLFHTQNHQVPNSEIDRVRKAVYLFGFTRPFSRYADSRLGKFIREELSSLTKKHDERFPLERSLWWVWYWEKFEKYDVQLLQGNPSLALHLVQHLSGAKVHYKKNAPHIDHIFPRSVLRDKGYDEADINHFANLWILAQSKNQNKSNKHPRKYFKDVSDAELQRAYIDKALLDYRRYRTFLKRREAKILEHVKKELELSDSDFNVSAHWEVD
jgi:5-methylcytosine-specific restriction endonuclease McrA